MYTLRRAATGFKDYLTPSTTSSSPPSSKPSPTPAPAPTSAPSSTSASTPSAPQTSTNVSNPNPNSKSTNIRQTALSTDIGVCNGSDTNDTITNTESLDSPLPDSDQDSESGSEHSFAFAEDIDIHGGGDIDAKHDHGYDPRRLHAPSGYASQRHVAVASILPKIGKEKSEGISGLRVLTGTSRPDTPEVYGLTESEADSDDLEDLDDVDFQASTTERSAQTQRLNSTSNSNLRNHAYPYSHSHYPPFLATSFKPQSRSLRNVHNLESWKAFANNEDISDWSVVRSSKKELADLHRLREEYEVMLKEKDESMEKERSTWEWIKKDLIEKQREELEDIKTRLEGEIERVKDDLQKTQTLLDAGNEELEMARQLLRQNTSGGDDSANLAAIDAGINRLKDGYEGRLREKEKVIDEQREAHERQRRELADALREVEKEMETKEEEWQKERQQMIAANEQRIRAYGYAAQSNATLIEKLRDDVTKMEALLDSRTKELEKAQSQLKKIQAKWKEVQDRGKREVSNDPDKLPSPLRVDVRKLFQAPNIQSATRDASTASSSSLKGRLPTKPSFPATSNSSVEDVKRLLETLNSDIFQFAAQFTDDIDQLQATDQNTPGFSESRRLEAAKEMSGLLGNGLVGYLTADPIGEDFDTIAQCALQTILLQWCGKVINMWAWSREVNRALKEMYEGMQVAGNQEPARRWRAMTRAQSRTKWEGEWSAIMERITASVMKFLIVVTRGRGISEEDEESKKQLTYQKLSSILGMAFQINKIIGEGITSADYEVLCPRPGETFDMRYMVDDNELPVVGKFQTDDEKKMARQKIVCACQLGLRRVIGEPISSLAIQQAIICKVRVLLPSALSDWDASLKMVE